MTNKIKSLLSKRNEMYYFDGMNVYYDQECTRLALRCDEDNSFPALRKAGVPLTIIRY